MTVDRQTPWAGRRVVIAHDWLTGLRGGERVLEAICRMIPDATIVTLLHAPGTVGPTIGARRIRSSFVQRLPMAVRVYRNYLPIFPTAIEQFDLDDADLVISTSHCAAKAVVPTGRAAHLCYCFSPMRYAWDQFDAYFGVERVGRTANAVLRPILAWLARWDAATANRVDAFVADSRHVAGRISRYYNRDASVVYPPVDTAFFTPAASPPDRYLLVVSALVPYKRLDLAIGAARAAGRPLTIVGTGPDEARLRAMAGPDVTFAGRVSEDELRTLYRHSTALVMPGEEDFGIAPVESLASGRPVIALARGGACETVEDGVSGVLVADPGAGDAALVDAFRAAIDRTAARTWDPAVLTARAARFAPDRFEAAFRAAVAALFETREAPAC